MGRISLEDIFGGKLIRPCRLSVEGDHAELAQEGVPKEVQELCAAQSEFLRGVEDNPRWVQRMARLMEIN